MRFNSHITTTAALVLAWGAIPAIAAGNSSGTSPAVRPNPDEQVLTANAAAAHSGQTASPAVQPNPDQQTAPATPSAGPRSEVVSGGGYGSVSVPPVVVRVTAPNGGFDWGDAGIGAAGAVGLLLVALGGALTVSRHRERQARSSARVAG